MPRDGYYQQMGGSTKNSGTRYPVAIIGPGNLGSALIFALHAARVPITEIVGRRNTRQHTAIARAVGAPVRTLREAQFDAPVLWFTTPDAAITAAAKRVLQGRPSLTGQVALHSSGVLVSTALEPLKSAGASIASVHPMMTFPVRTTTARSAPEFSGVLFAIEGDRRATRVARMIVDALGGESLALRAAGKPFYHLLGTFSSPLLVALMAASAEAGRAAGLSSADTRRLMRPIVERTVENFFARGPARSFSGPMARGDIQTVTLHLRALTTRPDLLASYRALAHFAVRNLPTQERKELEQILGSG